MGINTHMEKATAQAGSAPDAVTGAAITDNSSGTASSTIAAIGATYDQDEVRNAVASLAAELEANRVDIAALRATLAATVTDLTSAYTALNAGE